MRRTIKLHIDTPPDVVSNLVCQGGYRVIQRLPSVGITLQKITPTSDAKFAAQQDGQLTPTQKYELECQCDRIVDFFADPYSQTSAVRTRLHNLRQHLKTVTEQQHVLEYMDENFPEEG